MNGLEQETMFAWAAPPLKFGEGVLDEVGFAAAELGLRSAAVVTDPGAAAHGLAERVIVALRAFGIETHLLMFSRRISRMLRRPSDTDY